MLELPTIMASLEIEETEITTVEREEEITTQNQDGDNSGSARVLRKRVSSCESQESSKRRCSLRPTKLNAALDTDNIRGYFLSKKFRPVNVRTLATIYEEPKVQKNGTVLHVGATKLRRIIFNSKSKDKIKKRSAKVKKVTSQKGKKKGRLTMDAFLARLSGLMGNSTPSTSEKTNIITALVNCKVE